MADKKKPKRKLLKNAANKRKDEKILENNVKILKNAKEKRA